MTLYVIDTTMTVEIECEDDEHAERVAEELEHLYIEAALPRKARYWTCIEEL